MQAGLVRSSSRAKAGGTSILDTRNTSGRVRCTCVQHIRKLVVCVCVRVCVCVCVCVCDVQTTSATYHHAAVL